MIFISMIWSKRSSHISKPKSIVIYLSYIPILILILVPGLFGHKMLQIKDNIIVLGGLDNYTQLVHGDYSNKESLEESFFIDKKTSNKNADFMPMRDIVIINLNL